MENPHCIINPKTNRAVKIDSKLGKQILASQKNVKKEPHTQYKKPIGPVKPKEPHTQYKKPIGPIKPKPKPPIKKTIADNGNMDIVKFENILEDLVKKNPNLLAKSVDIMYLFGFDPKPSKFMKKLHNLDNRIPDTFQAVGKIYNNDTMKMERAFERIFLTEAEKNKVRKGWVNPRYQKTKEAKTEVKPKEANTQYKEPWKVGPNKFTKKNYEKKMHEDKMKIHRDRRDTQNLKESIEASKKQVNDGFKNLVNEWDTPNIGILFYQIAGDGPRDRTNLQNMIQKIVQLEGKKKAIIPSELFVFLVNPLYKVNENLLDLLVDEYGADKKGIDIIDEGMRNIIKHIEPKAILPNEIDYNYYSKHMNAKNKAKMGKMITDKYFSKK